MATQSDEPTGPDLAEGVPTDALPDGGMISGHVGKEPVLIVRLGEDIFAIGGKCTHYGGPLGEGVVSGETVRCPWHHACFNLRTGEAIRAPAFDPVPRWRVENSGDRIVVREKLPKAAGSRALSEQAARRRSLHHRRGRCCGLCGCGPVAPRGVRRRGGDPFCRCRAAGRQAEPLQGFPRRQGSRSSGSSSSLRGFTSGATSAWNWPLQ